MEITGFTNTVRFLLVAYFLTLLVQQLGVMTGLPIINVSNYREAIPWKLNSLSAEASHAARIIGVLMFTYLSLQEIKTGERYSLKKQFKTDRYIWIGFVWSMLTMQSATAILFFLIVFFKTTNLKNIVYAFVLLALAPAVLQLSGTDDFDRILVIFKAISTFDYRQILAADHSGSLRIAPLFVLTDFVELFSWNGIFGNGIDTVSTFMSDYIYGVEEGYTGGGLLRVWYEYGFISFLLFVIFSVRVSSALNSVSNFAFWFLIVFIAGPNNQILWMYLILLTSVEYFKISADQRPNTRNQGIGEPHGI